MNNLTKALIIIVLLTSVSYAKSSLDLGLAGVGARPMGMGKAFVAIADDANAVFQNPAGLGYQKSWGATSMSTRLLNRADYKLLSGFYPTNYGTFGLGYIGLMSPAGYKTTNKESLATAVPISYGSSTLYLSYGYDLNNKIPTSNLGDLSVGGSIKFINNNFNGVDNASGSGIETDLGLLLKPNKKVTVGAVLQNAWMGNSVSWASKLNEDMPSAFRLGVSYIPLDNVLLSLDTETATSNKPMVLHAGVEWTPISLFSLRVGADQDPSGPNSSVTNLTAGVGINVKGFHFDYAYRQDALQNDNSNHYISISIIPEKAAPPKIKPEIEESKITPKEEIPTAPSVAPETKEVYGYGAIIRPRTDASVEPAWMRNTSKFITKSPAVPTGRQEVKKISKVKKNKKANIALAKR